MAEEDWPLGLSIFHYDLRSSDIYCEAWVAWGGCYNAFLVQVQAPRRGKHTMSIADTIADLSNFSQSQFVGKTVTTSSEGIVAAQHRVAAMAGAATLAEGGNAVDAAIATSFTIGVAEPWMSGPGGGGAMMVYKAETNETSVIDFNMRSPGGLDPADFPLIDGVADDLFPWTRVRGDRNLKGATAIAVPGLVDGMATAHAKHATMFWKDLLQPAIALAEVGPCIDWYTSLMTLACVSDLAVDPEASRVFLPRGNAPTAPWTAVGGERLDFSAMAETLKRLAEAGPREYYEGELARLIANDVQRMGGSLRFSDLQSYHAREMAPLIYNHGDAELRLSPELTAGSTMAAALEGVDLKSYAQSPGQPVAADFRQLARAIHNAQDVRLGTMGDVDGGRAQTCTTSFSVVDKWGNMVVVTQTLLSIFGSKVVLPESGLLMNNGILWFDPEPGNPNSLGPNKRCLTNICPVIGVDGVRMFGLGASGGRKIMSAVLQLTSFLTDFGMSLEEAFHQGRIDCSLADHVIVDETLPKDVVAEIDQDFPTVRTKRTVYPYAFGCPSGVIRNGDENQGITEISSPWGDAVSETQVSG